MEVTLPDFMICFLQNCNKHNVVFLKADKTLDENIFQKESEVHTVKYFIFGKATKAIK